MTWHVLKGDEFLHFAVVVPLERHPVHEDVCFKIIIIIIKGFV